MTDKIGKYLQKEKMLKRIGEEQKDSTKWDQDMVDIGRQLTNLKNEEDLQIQNPQIWQYKGDNNQLKKAVTESEKRQRTYKSFNKMNEKEKELTYLKMRDELYQSKKRVQDIEKLLSNVNGQLQHLGKNEKKMEQLQNKDKEKYLLELENNRLQYKLRDMQKGSGVMKKSGVKKGIVGTVNNNRELLEQVDKLQSRLKESEENYKQLQEQIMLEQQSYMNNDKKNVRNDRLMDLQKNNVGLENSIDNLKKQLESSQGRVNDLGMDLQNQKEKNQEIQNKVVQLEIEKREKEELKDVLKDVKQQRERLEAHLDRLLESPFVKQHEEITKNKLIFDELNKQKEVLDKKKLQQGLELKGMKIQEQEKQNQLDENKKIISQQEEEKDKRDKQYQEQENVYGIFKGMDSESDEFNKILASIYLQGQIPHWKTLDYVQSGDIDYNDKMSLKEAADRLQTEKQDLAAQLGRIQTQLKLQIDAYNEQIRDDQDNINKMRTMLDERVKKANELTGKLEMFSGKTVGQNQYIFDKQGIQYDDSISVFSQTTRIEEYSGGMNSVDIYLEQIKYESYYKYQNSERFITLDFYDHQTQYSSFLQDEQIQLQVGYKVYVDDFLMDYFQRETIRIELYESSNFTSNKIGYGEISLEPLIKRNVHSSISAVINDSVVIRQCSGDNHNNKIIGLVKYRLKMRLPIQETIRWMQKKIQMGIIQQPKVIKEQQPIEEMKQLQVNIISGSYAINQKHATFVFFTLNNEDYNTQIIGGQSPEYNYRKNISIVYNSHFIQFVKHTPLKLYVINDKIAVENNLVGVAEVKLDSLVGDQKSNHLFSICDVLKNGQKVGQLKCNFVWFNPSKFGMHEDEYSQLSIDLQQKMVQIIADVFRSRKMSIISSYKMLANENHQNIHHDKFLSTLYILDKSINERDLIMFYDRVVKQNGCFDWGVFNKIFSPYFKGQEKYGTKQQESILEIKKRIQQQLERLDQNEVRRKLDLNNDGNISAFEFKVFLKQYNVQISSENIQMMLEFIDKDSNGSVDVDELLDFINYDNDELRKLFDQQNQGLHININFQRVNTELELFFNMLKQHMETNNLDIEQLFQQIDDSQNGMISIVELKDFMRTKLKMNISNPKNIQKYFDVNDDKQINLLEFQRILRNLELGVQKIQNKTVEVQNENTDEKLFYDKLKEYVRFEQITSKMVLYQKLDTNRDKKISFSEFQTFVLKKLKTKLQNPRSVFNSFDRDRSGEVTIDEFIRILEFDSQKYHAELYDDLKKGVVDIIDYIRNQINKHNIDLDKIFQDLRYQTHDQIDDRTISLVCKKMNINLQESQVQAIANELTSNSTKLMTVRDFKNLVQIKEFKQGVDLQLDDRLSCIVSNQSDWLVNQFRNMRDKNYDSKISFQNFQQIIQKVSVPDNYKIQNRDYTIIKNMFANELDLIDYVQFLKKYKIKSKKTASLQKKKEATDFFRSLGKILTRKKIDFKSAFYKFDQNKDGQITAQELISVFQIMGFQEYSDKQIFELFAVLDEDGSGELSLDEFIKALSG